MSPKPTSEEAGSRKGRGFGPAPSSSQRPSSPRPGRSSQAPHGKCPRCGTKTGPAQLENALCCLFGEPNDKGECAWCGDELPKTGHERSDKERVFCNDKCSHSFQSDALPAIHGSLLSC
jgi:hypothetical protein